MPVMLLRRFIGGLKALFRRDQRDQELDEELSSYLQAAAQDRMRAGMSHADAIHAARVEMGSAESVKQKIRASGWESAAEFLWQDVRYGMRQLLRNPGFSAVAVLTLALGIGANTAIFTLVHAVMLKQLPIANPQTLYRVGEGEYYCCEWGGLEGSWGTFDYPFYKHLRDTSPFFEQLAAFSGNTPSFNIRRANSSQGAQTTSGEYVSGNYFSTLGVQPALGRLLNPSDDRPGAPAAAVLGYRLWQQNYGSDPSIIGSTLLVNGLPVTLVGVAPAGFFGDRFTTSPATLWIPLNQQPMFEGLGPKSLLNSSGDAWLYVIGRLKPGVIVAQVPSQLSIDLQHWLRAQGRTDDAEQKIANQHIRLTAGGTGISPFRSNSKDGLYLLSAASFLVLLIACANLANLLLARSATREHQTALRLSLGATRWRLMRAVLTETVLLSLIGGAAGLLLAYVGTRSIVLIAFRGATYIPVDATPSLPVLGFAFLLSIVTGLIFGVAPAWMSTRADPSEGLRGSSRSSTAHASRPQRVLVIVQAALSVALLAVAGLVTQSLNHLEKADMGFQTQGRLVANLNFKAAGYKPEQLAALYDQLQDRLEALPGVRSASLSLNSPQNLCCISLDISIGGRAESWIGNVDVNFSRVSPHYFESIGTPVLRGRPFKRQDTQSSQHVAVVDDDFAHRFFSGKDAIGEHIGLSLPGHGYDYEIVGVVRNTTYRSPTAAARPMFFVPFSQVTHYDPSGYQRLETETLYAQSIQLRVSGAPETYENALRQVLAGINADLSLDSVKSYSEQVAIQFNQQRLIARLTGLFSLLALALASIGLYGVTAYNVARRTGEIGVRMALGANRANVVGMVLWGALSQIGLGLCIGIPLALLCGRALAHQLYGVSTFDPFVISGAVLVLSMSALVAGLLPARRAASVEPMEALRIE
jgi:macrolide transport system ATP-binding/permease protein